MAAGVEERSPSTPGSFLRALREAIAGSHQDFTEGNIGRAIALLSIPMVLEMVMESLFGVVDMFFVARLGADAAATVGLTASLLTLLFPSAIGLSTATAATVARRTGEKDREAAAIAGVQGIFAGLILAIVGGALGAWFARDLLRLMGATPGMIARGSGYASILLGGSGTLVLLFVINAVFRAAGDAAIAMRVLWLANLINIVLVPCLINGWGPFPKLGLAGAAVGTTIGRSVGVLYQFAELFSGRSRIRVGRQDLKLDAIILRSILRVSVGGTLQYAIAHLSWLALVRIIAEFGSHALAAYTVGIRIIVFAILPSWGMSNAAATLVGQCLGAGKPDRAEESVWRTAIANAIFLSCVAAVFILFAEPIIRIFISDPDVVATGADCLRLISYGYPFYAFGMVMVQAFNGAGDTFTPTMVNLFCYWLCEIPLAFVLSKGAGLGPDGVFWAITVAESITACVGVLLFRRGRWKTQKI